MFEEIFNLGGDKEKQKLIEIDKTLKPDDAINIQKINNYNRLSGNVSLINLS